MTDQPPLMPAHKDRSTGLLVFGIILILVGLGCLFFCGVMGLMGLAVPTNSPQQTKSIFAGMAVYLVLAAGFIWLGIGSIQARRWVRPMVLIFGWPWLIFGTLGVILSVCFLPAMVAKETLAGQPDAEAAVKVTMVIMMAILTLVFTLLPAVLLAFYQAKSVKATCERKDPVIRWTDHAPVPVLAVSIWLAFMVFSFLATAICGMAVFPVFGWLISGLAGSSLAILAAVILLWMAWSIYRLEIKGWWAAVGLVVLFSVSAIVTYSLNDISNYYAALGYTGEQLEKMRSMTFVSGQNYALMTAIWMILSLGYMIYIKRFFPKG